MGMQPGARRLGTAASELGRPSPWAFPHEIWPRALPHRWRWIRWGGDLEKLGTDGRTVAGDAQAIPALAHVPPPP
jgi:hypothetical protein